ncbi:GNAT family N-acetyltransferase [Acinetobacter sp. HY1485]|uniref:GNAT family N-acetyltransferase n=1 Tax=Acinetobacter sp. HY1485 TaxID=2970918 RepID=UPI0022B95B74|nr:GNAT family N-acetyltransferase [Acinetobacter sp. HY1485]
MLKTITPWLALRHEFWAQLNQEEHKEDIHHILNKKISRSAFLLLKDNNVIGFAEVALRSYSNGCFFQPVPFLEGFYIKPNEQGKKYGKFFINQVEQELIQLGYKELCSSTDWENTISQAVHTALNFTEVDRIVLYHKRLMPV